MKRKAKEIPPKPAGPCAVAGCKEPGEYKAPRERHLSGEYQYLCLNHVREFNKAWDYFDGWNREAIESFMHEATHGHRPTWKMGHGPTFTSEALRDSFFRMLGEAPPKSPRQQRTERKQTEALSVLDLEPGVDMALIKKQYKKLVKKYHPDVNKSPGSEETFKRITVAYTFLIKTFSKAT